MTGQSQESTVAVSGIDCFSLHLEIGSIHSFWKLLKQLANILPAFVIGSGERTKLDQESLKIPSFEGEKILL